MPSLLEILNDPNYVNANQATKEAIFNKYSAQDRNYVDANEATQSAIRQRFGLGGVGGVEEITAEPTQDTGFFDMAGRAVARGFKQTGSLLGDVLPAMAAKAVGANEYAARQMREAEATQKEIAQKYAPRYGELSDVQGLGDVLPFVTETVLEQIPNIATALVPGAGGAALGGRMAAQQAAKMALAKEAAQAAAVTGAARGATAGAFLGSYALNAPEVFQNIYDATKDETGVGKMEVGASVLAGSVSAALDSILPSYMVKQFTPGMKAGLVEKILERSGMAPGVAREATAGVITGVLTEAPTEAAQEAISIAAEKFVKDNGQIWDSKDFNRMIEAGVRGAVGGGGISAIAGGAKGFTERVPAEAQPTAPPTVPSIVPETTPETVPQAVPETTPVAEAAPPALVPTTETLPVEAAPVEQPAAPVESELSKIQTKEVYRVGDPYQTSGMMPSNLTAGDIVSYERDELGNAGVQPMPGIDLSSVPASKTKWVTFDKKSAQEYVDLEAPAAYRQKLKKSKETFRVLAADPYGGYLIEVNPEQQISQETAQLGLPPTPEQVERATTMDQLSKELEQKGQLTKDNNLYNFFFYGPKSKKEGKTDNRLDMKEVFDVSPDKSFNFIRKKGGAFISDFISSGSLNDWLPYEMRVYGTEDATELADKEDAGTEYIKEALRNRDYLPYETKVEMEQIGRTLDSFEDEIRQEADLEDLRDTIRDIIETEGTADIESAIASFPKSRGAEPVAAPVLTQYTAAEEEARLARAEEDRAAAEAKAIADREREVFALTPQVAEQPSAPTGDLFGARGLAEQPTRATPEAPPTETGLFAPTTKGPGFFNDITSASYNSQHTLERSPSFKREFERLNKLYADGKITADAVVYELQQLRSQLSQERFNRLMVDRKRGAQIVKEKLLAAKRRGDLPAEAVDMAEWFINKNPELLVDLGITLRQPSERGGLAGQYLPLSRIVRIIKGTSSATAPTHEILHHLERMMPDSIRAPIQQSWMRSFLRSQDEANKSGDYALKKYYQLLSDYHFGNGTEESLRRASELIESTAVPYEHYQNFNSSEFWAVNASRIVKGRFDSRGAALTKLKQWLSELSQKIKAVFGAKSDASIINALDSLARADGKFITSSMLGESDVYNSVIRKNIFGQPVTEPMWGRPEDTKMDNIAFVLTDKMIDTKRIQEQIQKAAGEIADQWNAYRKETLYHGRTSEQTLKFIEQELDPLVRAMKAKGVTIEELEEFLHNNHAIERNQQVAKVNPDMPDQGSGIESDKAEEYFKNLSKDKTATLGALADRVYAIIKNTQDLLLSSGLETQDTIDAWNKTYKKYVPLFREEQDYEASNIGRGVGKGYGVSGAATRRATGSTRPVIDILANIAMQRERTIVRSEKLRVAQAIYGLSAQYPNPDFWLAIDPKAMKDIESAHKDLISLGFDAAAANELLNNLMQEPRIKTVDPVTNQVVARINIPDRFRDNVLPVRINGSDKYVFFNTRDPRAVRMVRALKNLDAQELSQAMSIAGRFTRYFAAVNTQYNPIFGVINFMRDVQGAVLNLSTTPIADMTKQVLGDTVPALAGIYADIRSRRAGNGPATGQWAKLWEDFRREGGQTGFRDQFSRSEERAEALANSMAKLSQGKVRGTFEAVKGWLSDYNETLENAVRLAAYKAALDKGLSKEQAASVAKELTVNFNRKGDIGRQMNALYAFFNASVQGTARMLQTLRGPMGKKIMYGALLLGSAQAMLLAAAGFDEDEPPDFVKERNIIIPLFNGGRYISIPMPLGFNVLPNFSRVMTEWTLAGFQDPSKRIAQITGAALEAFNPIGNAGWSFQTFAPTIADPMVALFENKDWTGKPIAKKDVSSLDPTPGYTRARDTSSWASTQLSYFLNLATGGTKYQPGFISPTPDQIDYLIGQATGGVGREALKTEQAIRSSITGEELPSYKIPLAGRFYGTTEEAAGVRDKFYKNIERLNRHENEVNGRLENGEDVQEYLFAHPDAVLAKDAHKIEREIQKLRKMKQEMKKQGVDKDQIKMLDEIVAYRMQSLNDMVQFMRP